MGGCLFIEYLSGNILAFISLQNQIVSGSSFISDSKALDRKSRGKVGAHYNN